MMQPNEDAEIDDDKLVGPTGHGAAPQPFMMVSAASWS